MKEKTKRQKGDIFEHPKITIVMMREDILVTSTGWGEEQFGWGDDNGDFPEEFGV